MVQEECEKLDMVQKSSFPTLKIHQLFEFSANPMSWTPRVVIMTVTQMSRVSQVQRTDCACLQSQ